MGLRHRRIATGLTVVASVLAVLPLTSSARADGPTTHTWVGADTKDNRDWGQGKNWDDQKVPQDGDIVIVDRSATIYNIPSDKTFTSVSLSKGARLVAKDPNSPEGPLIAGVISMDCATLQNVEVQPLVSMTVTGGWLSSATVTVGPGADMVVRGATPLLDSGCSEYPTQAGVLTMQFASRLAISGSLHGDGGRILGGTGTPVLELAGSGVLGRGAEKLVLDAVTADLGGIIDGTGVSFAAGSRVQTLRGAATAGPGARGLRLMPGAVARFSAALPPATGGTTQLVGLGNILVPRDARVVLAEGAILEGTPTFYGGGTLELTQTAAPGNQPPTIQGTVTTAADTTLAITGDGRKDVAPYDRNVPDKAGQLVAKGSTVLAGRGEIRVRGGVDLAGAVTVPEGTANAPVFRGASCCSEPVISLTVRRTASIGKQASLTVDGMRLDLLGKVTGDGMLALVGGSHRLAARAALDVADTRVLGGPLQLPAGTVSLGGALTLDKDAELRGAEAGSGREPCGGAPRYGPFCESKIVGKGRILWRPAGITGVISGGPELRLDMFPGSHTVRDSRSRLSFDGGATLDGRLRMEAGASLELGGITTVRDLVAYGSSCCLTRAILRIGTGGVADVAKDAAPSLSALQLQVYGDLFLNGYSLSSDNAVYVAPAGRLLLGGGTLTAQRGLLVAAGLGTWGVLAGPGRVDGDVAADGYLRVDKSGELRIIGDLDLDTTSIVVLPLGRSAGASGRVWVLQDAALDGGLKLTPIRGVPRGLALLTAGRVTGRFSNVQPPARAVAYSRTAVRLR